MDAELLERRVTPPLTRMRRRKSLAYAIAIAMATAVVLLRTQMELGPDRRESIEVIFILPVIVSAYVGGLGPGLLATVLSSIGADYFTLTPYGSLAIASTLQLAEWALMLVMGALVSALSEALHRARARAELTTSLQAELARVVQTAPGVLYTFRLRPDGTTSVPYASPGIREIFQLEPEQLAQSAAHIFAMMPAEDAARMQHALDASAAKLEPWRDEFRIHRADGTELWLEGHSVPVREPDGGTLWHGFISDVTERKRAVDTLRATRETLQLLIHQAPVSIAMLDRNMTYLAASGRWLAEYGRGHAELVGRNHYDVHPDVPEWWRAIHQECLAGAVRFNDDDEWTQADGSRHWLRWAIHPWRTGAAEVGGIIIFAEDITGRKRDEEALHASERRHRDLVEMSPDAIFVNRDGKIVFVNKAAVRLFGATRPEEVLGHLVTDFVHPDDHTMMREAMSAIARGDAMPTHGRRIVRLDGSILTVDAVAAPFTDREGPGFQVIFRDVTEQRQHAQEIAEREARFAGIINSAMDGIITVDDEQKIVLANPAAERLFQRSANELVGQPLKLLLPERYRAAHRAHVRDFVADGTSNRRKDREMPLFGMRANGEEFPIETSISQVVIDGQRLLTAILRDVSERQLAERALRDSEERFRQLAESIQEVFWLSNPHKGTLEYVSPAYETIWGRSLRDLYEQPFDWMDAVHELDRERVAAAATTKQIAGTYDEEYRIVRPDGSVRWIRDRASPVRNDHGEVIRIAGVAEDITERRELEAQVRQTQKLESVGLLAGGVAHDLNNWLTVIVGNSQFLLPLVGEQQDAIELIGEIRNAADRSASLTRQLLAFSRQQVLEPRVLDLNAVVTDTEKMLGRLIGEDVVLETVLEATSPVLVDPGHLSQVLMNLAVNARDAMPTGGRLTLKTRDVVLDATQALALDGLTPGSYVRLTISDTGVGIPPEARARIFEPFFTTKAVGRGTGLGLAVVHGIITQSGGRIVVSSEVGLGTEFTIYFPVAGRPRAATPAKSVAISRGAESILVVEDEQIVRKIAARTLRSAGYRVSEAGDGREALHLLQEEKLAIDLLVTDVVMPTMGGRALVDEVRVTRPGIKVLFCSGYTDDAVVRHGVLSAEVAFLQKPYSMSGLLEKIREVLDLAP